MSDGDLYCCGDSMCHWHVYYCYAADGTLLYVGQSSELSWRLYHHTRFTGSSWFGYCATVTASPALPTASEARALERAEIKRLHPVYNRNHNREPTAWVPNGQPWPYGYGSMPEITWLSTAEHATA